MYTVKPTTKFQKDLKKIKKRGYDIFLLTEIIKKLAVGELCQRKIETIFSLEILSDVESVILPQLVIDESLILYLTRKVHTVICFKEYN